MKKSLHLILMIAAFGLLAGRADAQAYKCIDNACPMGKVPAISGPRGPAGPQNVYWRTSEASLLCSLAIYRCVPPPPASIPQCDPGDIEFNPEVRPAGFSGLSGITTIAGVPTVVSLGGGLAPDPSEAIVTVVVICADTTH